jgi:hypothetical protein
VGAARPGVQTRPSDFTEPALQGRDDAQLTYTDITILSRALLASPTGASAMLDVQTASIADEGKSLIRRRNKTCDHHEPLLRTMSIADMCAEWWLLRRDEPHPGYAETDEGCCDPGECRYDRRCVIEIELSNRPADSIDDVLSKFVLMERVNYDSLGGQVPGVAESIKLSEECWPDTAEITFNHSAPCYLFVSILRDLHFLTRGRES